MVKFIVLHIWLLLIPLLVGCNRYDPAFKECFAAKADILDSLELDSDSNRIRHVSACIPRYDVEDVTKYCNLLSFTFTSDSGLVYCRYDNVCDTFDLFQNVPSHDTAYYTSEVIRFLTRISDLTTGTGFVFGGYSNNRIPQACFILLYKQNREYHLYCASKKDELIDDYKKEHPNAVIYEIYKNWILIQLSESLYELHVNQCG